MKRVHMASKVAEDGSVSALCYFKPRRIDMRFATWTTDAKAVTCEACRLRLRRLGTDPCV